MNWKSHLWLQLWFKFPWQQPTINVSIEVAQGSLRDTYHNSPQFWTMHAWRELRHVHAWQIYILLCSKPPGKYTKPMAAVLIRFNTGPLGISCASLIIHLWASNFYPKIRISSWEQVETSGLPNFQITLTCCFEDHSPLKCRTAATKQAAMNCLKAKMVHVITWGCSVEVLNPEGQWVYEQSGKAVSIATWWNIFSSWPGSIHRKHVALYRSRKDLHLTGRKILVILRSGSRW